MEQWSAFLAEQAADFRPGFPHRQSRVSRSRCGFRRRWRPRDGAHSWPLAHVLRHEGQHTQCLYIGTGEGALRPPSNPRHPPLREQRTDGERRPPNPRPAAPLTEQCADGGHRPPNPLTGAPLAERRTVQINVRVSAAERAAWDAKAAAAGVPLSTLLRKAMGRTRTWTAPAADIERERNVQVARIGNNLNQLARWANTHTSAVEAVAVIANLVAFERSLHAVARLGGEDGDAH